MITAVGMGISGDAKELGELHIQAGYPEAEVAKMVNAMLLAKAHSQIDQKLGVK